MNKSILTTLADTCESVANRLDTLRPAGFSDADIVKLRKTAETLNWIQNTWKEIKNEIQV